MLGAAGAGRLVVPQVPVPCGGSRLGHAYSQARVLPRKTAPAWGAVVQRWPSPRVTVAAWLGFDGGLTAAQGVTRSPTCLSLS